MTLALLDSAGCAGGSWEPGLEGDGGSFFSVLGLMRDRRADGNPILAVVLKFNVQDGKEEAQISSMQACCVVEPGVCSGSGAAMTPRQKMGATRSGESKRNKKEIQNSC